MSEVKKAPEVAEPVAAAPKVDVKAAAAENKAITDDTNEVVARMLNLSECPSYK